MVSIMNKCYAYLIKKLESSADPEAVIPRHFEGSKEDFAELCMIYLKYGGDPDRKKICEEKLKC